MLDSLSSELLHHICRQLDSASDVSSFRMVCKSFAAVGLRSLLPRLTLVTLPKAFEHLSNVANHPVLRHHVREIVFVTNALQKYRDINDFARNRPRPGRLRWAVKPDDPHATAADLVAHRRQYQGPEMELHEAWRCYEELCMEQDGQEKNDDGLAALQQTVAKLPRLRTVQIRQLRNEGKPASVIWSKFDEFFVSCLTDTPSKFLSTNSHLEAILRGTLAGKNALEELSLAGLDARFFLCENLDLDKTQESLEKLRKIELQINMEDEADSDCWDQCRQHLNECHLSQLLRSAAELQSISITAPHVAIEDHVAIFPEIFNDIKWSHLSCLHLVGFETTSGVLVTFLEAHAGSLRVLQLGDFKLSKQKVHEWHSFFVRICSFLHLENAQFSGHFSADFQDAINDNYIDMGDEVEGVPTTVGDTLRALLCHSYLEPERDLLKDILQDLLLHGKKRLAVGFRMEIPVRHHQYLLDITKEDV